ncbi:MAG TPA: hypothetical protein VFW90_01730, partial [Candidatus Saccharimonadales bacterium]|nr:hypothetical protein [Candidatus Saccharimonadales bacterium]
MSNEPKKWDADQIKLGASLLQSSGWSRFQQALGFPVHFLSEAGWSCLFIERPTPFGKYLFAPYGPTITKLAEAGEVFSRLKSFARQVGAGWLRL